MNDKNIIIKKIENRENDFIAFFKADFLRATYCVCFKDNVFGAVALNNFYEMIKYKYNDDDNNKMANIKFLCRISTQKSS